MRDTQTIHQNLPYHILSLPSLSLAPRRDRTPVVRSPLLPPLYLSPLHTPLALLPSRVKCITEREREAVLPSFLPPISLAIFTSLFLTFSLSSRAHSLPRRFLHCVSLLCSFFFFSWTRLLYFPWMNHCLALFRSNQGLVQPTPFTQLAPIPSLKHN